MSREAPEIFMICFRWFDFVESSVNFCQYLPLSKVMIVLPVDHIRLCSVVLAQTNHDSTWFTVPTRPILVF